METAPFCRGSGPNPIDPEQMTARERRTELCRLLAFGLFRLHAREASKTSENIVESSLHNSANQSVHATPIETEIA
jgi:hypothetical protein